MLQHCAPDFPNSFPSDLDQVLQSTLGGGRNLSATLEKLWPILAEQLGRTQGGAHYAMNADFVSAYSAYYLTANVMKWPRVLSELKQYGVSLDRKLSWLDLGCGPGTALLGAAWWLRNQNNELLKTARFVAVDHSSLFLEQVKKNFRAIQTEWDSAPALDVVRGDIFLSNQVLALIEKNQSDVVSFSNSFVESTADLDAKTKYLKDIITKLKSLGGLRYLVLLEPGTKKATRDLLEVRKRLIADQDINTAMKVLLPCFSDRECGALKDQNDWCHEAVDFEFPEWHQRLGQAAGLKKEMLLYSYLVLAVGDVATLNFKEASARVVSQIMKEKGLTKCWLCTSEGKRLARVLDKKRCPDNEAFFELKRGSSVDDLALGEKGDVERI